MASSAVPAPDPVEPPDARRSARRELAAFLQARRRRLSPRDVGLPDVGRRRVVGLRRDEVAVLAGLSSTWYSYLEQGRDIVPSPELLDRLATVLRLTEDERRYLRSLAHGAESSATRLDGSDLDPVDLLDQVVSAADEAYPAYACHPSCDVLAWNDAACEWYGDWAAMPDPERNIVHWALTSPEARERLVDWESVTRDILARFRSEFARRPDDPRMVELVATFARVSPEFPAWWQEHEVLEHRTGLRRLRHPDQGVRTMRVVPLLSPEYAPAGVVLHLPVPPHV